VSDQKQTYSVN